MGGCSGGCFRIAGLLVYREFGTSTTTNLIPESDTRPLCSPRHSTPTRQIPTRKVVGLVQQTTIKVLAEKQAPWPTLQRGFASLVRRAWDPCLADPKP